MRDAKQTEADSGQHPLNERNNQIPFYDGVNRALKSEEYAFIVAIIERRKLNKRLPHPLTIAQEVVERDEEDTEREQRGRDT